MAEGKDYLAMVTPEPEDRQDHGVKGMKWGIRRSDAQLKAAAAKRGDSPASTETKKTVTDGAETSSARYSRLKAQAKAGKGSEMSDEDLKFFNARTEALSKIAKMNETKPGWIADTAKKVLQQTAQNGMQEVVDALRKKHITGPIVKSIKDK